MQNDDGQYGAIINAGEHRTIKELFTAIEDAFSNESAIDIQAVLGHVVKVVLEFSNLGPVSTKPIALSLDDDDRKLQNLRWAIVCGFDDFRPKGVGERVVALATVFFHKEI